MTSYVLRVKSGAHEGKSVVVQPGHCVMLVRVGAKIFSTGMIAMAAELQLEEEDRALVEGHLRARRKGKAAEEGSGHDLLESFERDDDLPLHDEKVSTQHAMIFLDEHGLSLLDMGSTNGTYVNGVRVTSTALVAGDLLRVGETRLSIEAA